jgi:hypothetical protein
MWVVVVVGRVFWWRLMAVHVLAAMITPPAAQIMAAMAVLLE